MEASIAAAVQRLRILGLGFGFAVLRENRVVRRLAWLAAQLRRARLASHFDALRRGCTARQLLRRGATAAAARLSRALRAWAAAHRGRASVLRSMGQVRRMIRGVWQARPSSPSPNPSPRATALTLTLAPALALAQALALTVTPTLTQTLTLTPTLPLARRAASRRG